MQDALTHHASSILIILLHVAAYTVSYIYTLLSLSHTLLLSYWLHTDSVCMTHCTPHDLHVFPPRLHVFLLHL